MAINFPATAGQPTDGSYTYTVAGIVYAWDGTSWTAAGAGASATDRTLFSVTTNSAGTAALSYTSATGVFSYTPPDVSVLSGPNINDGSGSALDADLLDGEHGSYYRDASNLNAGTIPNARLSGLGTPYDIDISGNAATASSVSTGITGLSDVTITSPTNNEVLTYTGSGWVNSAVSVTGLQGRATNSATVALANGAVGNSSINTGNTYALLKVETSHAAWVTLYSSTTARTNDSARARTTDPTPGSGVLAEVITTGAQSQWITPAVVGFSETQNNTTYIKIVNDSGSTVNLQVTLTYVKLEA
tara:strand:- start:1469 stop:2377 length:909 start_codon:yes stop_codon:yes gene_type:complete